MTNFSKFKYQDVSTTCQSGLFGALLYTLISFDDELPLKDIIYLNVHAL